MNFVDTAITLLHLAGKPMAVEELCRQAVERDLLDKPGANPLRSMKARMTVELKKGRKSRLLKEGDAAWRLRAGAKLPDGCAEVVKELTKRKAKRKSPVTGAASASKLRTEKPSRKGGAARKKLEPSTEETLAPQKKRRVRKSKTSAKALPKDVIEDQESAPAAASARGGSTTKISAERTDPEPPAELTEEEKGLVALYGDQKGTTPAAELNEYRDHLTKDEDRPMLPEIRAERRPYRHDRGRRPRTFRARSSYEENGGTPAAIDKSERRPQNKRSERFERPRSPMGRGLSRGPRDIAGAPISPVVVKPMSSELLVRCAVKVLGSLPAGQTMPVRQLTQAMVRQNLLEGDPDQLWKMVKGLLLVSEQRRKTRGLRVLVRYHGRDLFSAGIISERSAVDVASSALDKAAEVFMAAVEADTLDRLASLALPMLERIAYIYLCYTGWTDVEWVRRVENSSYAIATAPGAVDQSMVAVRSGPEKVDRRGIGELRAGVYAKDLVSGLLLSPCELSDEADIELAKEGVHIRVLCGRDFIAELISREIGVTWQHIQLPKIDQRFFDAVLG